MKKIQKNRKITSAFCLAAYLFICGFSTIHSHKTNYLLNHAYSAPVKSVQDSNFHYQGFCLLHQFSATQLSTDANPFSPYAPAKFYLNVSEYTSVPFSSEINSILKRGPPTLS